jgi:hypothetical protein
MRAFFLLLGLLVFQPALADVMGPAPGVVARLATAGPAPATAPSIDGTTTIGLTTSTSLVLTLTTTQPNDRIVLVTDTGGGNSVTGVTGCSLTFTPRTIVGSTAFLEYTAVAASPLSACAITITWNYSNANQGVAFGIAGTGTVAPSFDSNASLAVGSTSTSANYSTSNALDLAICVFSTSGSSTPGAPPGFTSITPGANNVNASYISLSSTQSSTTVTPPTSGVGQILIDAFKD